MHTDYFFAADQLQQRFCRKIGTPGISSANYTIANSNLNPICNYLSFIHDQIGSTVWTNNIGEVYMNEESVYGAVDYGNICTNQCIKHIIFI